MRGFRGGVGALVRLDAIIGGVTKALSLGMGPISLPEMRFSRKVHRYDGGTFNRTTTLHARNGLRERERRMRQIARGSLTEANGLMRGIPLRGPL